MRSYVLQAVQIAGASGSQAHVKQPHNPAGMCDSAWPGLAFGPRDPLKHSGHPTLVSENYYQTASHSLRLGQASHAWSAF